MNTSESIDLLSDVLLDDERIVSNGEREFLADLIRHSENNPKESNPEVTRAIARIAGEIVVQRAGALVGEGILRRLAGQNFGAHEQQRQKEFGTSRNSKSGGIGPRPPHPVPPNPGPAPGTSTTFAKNHMANLPGPRPPFPVPPNPGPAPGVSTTFDGKGRMATFIGPRPPHPVPPNPGPAPGTQSTIGPKGILDPEIAIGELQPPKCVVLEEFLAPAEVNDLLAYTLAHEEHVNVSEVISPGGPIGGVKDFDYRRSHVLMDLGPHQQRLLDRLGSILPRVLPKLGLEPFPISRMEAQITSSKDGDFFRWHSDNGEGEVAARQVTFVYFFHREPKAFEGGELRIQGSSCNDNGDTSGNYYAIVPRQNQLVLFDSSLTHEIAPVNCPSGKFSDSRFTMNGWFSR